MNKSPRKLTEEHKRKLALSKMGDKNPSKRPEVRAKMSKARKGKTPWNKNLKGIHLSPATEFKKGIIPWAKLHPELVKREEESHAWKGDKYGYQGIHAWIRRQKGKATTCTTCLDTKNVQWANKSGEYKRDLNDWIELCGKCHSKYDRENIWGAAKRRFGHYA